MYYSVVALHGLTGHAWNTFTTSEVVDKHANRTKENNWLQDSLPELLKQNHPQRIYSRVMSFGYNADVWMTKSVADLDDPVKNLLHYLELERRQVNRTVTWISIMLNVVRILRGRYSSSGTAWVE